ncbi:hypothetical protein BT93_L4152 [Corymbia citriodora subsp. variegata]|uniref:Anaphase-promoting complex subunit 4-like WD40 domain-containing protein n=1 Tax=Corymbia citriodora subsp. variegata TaxID=360336 RepID=A0A8T0CZ04_CORYI|nr:hypothetical protein BT93_L4152 [Corymbia citriodora subsp. variegata]KAF7851295.1 hypothetical protein BT93_L4152 [Corymbia citriodora subsp. variegata]
MAEWNPEKESLATVTEDSKVWVLHRFNCRSCGQSILGKWITSLCWRPDSKVVVLGLQDGTVLLHDVEVSFLCCYLNITLITSQLQIPLATILYHQNLFFSNLSWERF